MDDCPIYISSSDSYSDLWPLFFDLFEKYWPEYKGTIYLNTESIDFHHERLDIRCTKVGKLSSFGRMFRAGLDKISSPFLMLIMIDYFFMGKVKNHLILELFEYFKNSDLDSLCLKKQNYDNSLALNYRGLHLVIPPSKDMFSYQIAFWKKEMLYEMALPHESPWLSEWYGTIRANRMQLKLAFTDKCIIPYLAEGALHKGKWVTPMIQFLAASNYIIDYSERGFFNEKPIPLQLRIKERLKTFFPRCQSNLYLIKMRFCNK